MPPSYRDINYRLRPAKHIERRMFCDALMRLSYIAPLWSYRYVGFGSIFFSDFYLFHRVLGIGDMLSIEWATTKAQRDRVEMNRPFGCIDIEFGRSSDVLPDIDWNPPTIAWLDYDRHLDRSMLADVGTFCRNAKPGSVIIVTVAADIHNPEDQDVEEVREAIGAEHLPPELRAAHLGGWGTADIYYSVIARRIKSTLETRNIGAAASKTLRFRQLFHFNYADGSKMLTMGGLLYDTSQAKRVAKCKFGDLPFLKFGKQAFRIDVPILTPREILLLDRDLPADEVTLVEAPMIPPGDIRRYREVYKYFPRYVDADY